MDLHSLEITIKRVPQPGPLPLDHEVTIKSNNLSLEQSEAMQSEIAPALLNWLKVEVKEDTSSPAQPKA